MKFVGIGNSSGEPAVSYSFNGNFFTFILKSIFVPGVKIN